MAEAEAEVALTMCELGGSARGLLAATATLEAHADPANGLHVRLLAVRRLLLLGKLPEAAAILSPLDTTGVPPALATMAALPAA